MIDNASSHCTYELLPTLQHVRILFLPKRTKSLMQPLDAGVIACIKRKYLRCKIERAVDLIESIVSEKLYDIDLKLAVTWIIDTWNRLQVETIVNCWNKAGLKDG